LRGALVWSLSGIATDISPRKQSNGTVRLLG
jgi:hypothetical protein